MITNSDLQFFFTQLNTTANAVYKAVTVKSTAFSTTLPVESEVWKTSWIGLLPKMRPWDGPRYTKEPAPQSYAVTPYAFEDTIALDRFRFDDDMYGVYSPLVERLARETARAQDYEIRDLLQNRGKWTGGYQNGWDGLSYFSTGHNVDFYNSGAGTYSNDFTSGGSTQNGILVGGALSQTSIKTIHEYMSTIKGEDGEALEVEPDTIVVPSTLWGEADQLLHAAFYAPPSYGTLGAGTGPLGANVGAIDNPLMRYGLKALEWPLLNTGGSSQQSIWYMMALNHSWRPLLWLLRQAPVFTYLVDEKSVPVFYNHQYVYGAWARWAPAWGPSWLMSRSGP